MSIEIGYKAFNQAIDIIGDNFGKPAAAVLVMAIGGQESKYLARRQLIKKGGKLVPEGPAVSFWQFEENGGVRGVLQHPANETLERRLCAVQGVRYEKRAVWEAMQHDDVLGAGMARMLLAADSKRLPDVGDVEGAWDYYLRVWRPGKPHKDTWAKAYAEARRVTGF